MAYLTGIELELKENVTTKLERMIPMVERLQRAFNRLDTNMSTSEGIKRTNAQLDMMNSKLKKVQQTSGEMRSIGNTFNNLGNSAHSASKKVGALSGAIRQIGSTLKDAAIFGGIFGAIGLTAEGIKKGANFQQAVGSLAFQGYSSEQQERIQSMALDVSKKRLMSPTEAVDYVKLAATTLPKETAIGTLGIAADFQTAMRKLNVKNALEENVSEEFLKSAEQMTYRTPSLMKMWAEKITKMEVAAGGKVPISTIKQQTFRAGAAKFGADPDAFLAQLGFISAQSSGAKGGSGSQGSVGVMMQAVQSNLFSGRMALAQAQALADIGLLDGWEQAKPKIVAKMLAKHHKGAAHGRTINKLSTSMAMGADGQMHMGNTFGQQVTFTRGGGSTFQPEAKLTTTAMKEYGVRVAGADIAQKYGGIGWAEQVLIPALERHHKMQPGTFFNMADDPNMKVKAMEMLVPIFGPARITLQRMMDELLIGHKQWLQFEENMKKAPGMAEIVNKFDDRLIVTKFNQMLHAWESFTDRVFADKAVLKVASDWIDTFTKAINAMNGAAPAFSSTLVFFSDWLQAMIKMGDALIHPGQVLPDEAKTFIKGGKQLLDPYGNLTGGKGSLASKLGAIPNRFMNQAGATFNRTLVQAAHMLVPPPPPQAVSTDPLAMFMKQQANMAGMMKSYSGPVPPPPDIHVHYHGPAFGVDQAKHGKEIAKAVEPHLQRNEQKRKQQFSQTSSMGVGNHVPSSFGRQPQ